MDSVTRSAKKRYSPGLNELQGRWAFLFCRRNWCSQWIIKIIPLEEKLSLLAAGWISLLVSTHGSCRQVICNRVRVWIKAAFTTLNSNLILKGGRVFPYSTVSCWWGMPSAIPRRKYFCLLQGIRDFPRTQKKLLLSGGVGNSWRADQQTWVQRWADTVTSVYQYSLIEYTFMS